MVLYRANEYKTLRLLRNLALETLIPRAQAVIRGGILRNYARGLRKAEDDIEQPLTAADDYKGLVEAVEASSNVFVREQLKLFDYQPRNLKVAKKMITELEEWLSLEQEMKKLAEVDDPNPHYETLKKLDAKVTQTIERQTKAAAEADQDFYERKAYRQPKLTASQTALIAKMKELILQCKVSRFDELVSVNGLIGCL